MLRFVRSVRLTQRGVVRDLIIDDELFVAYGIRYVLGSTDRALPDVDFFRDERLLSDLDLFAREGYRNGLVSTDHTTNLTVGHFTALDNELFV